MKDFQLGVSFEDGDITIEVSRIAIRFYAQQTVDCITKTIPMDLTLEEFHALNRMISHAASEAQGLRFGLDTETETI